RHAGTVWYSGMFGTILSQSGRSRVKITCWGLNVFGLSRLPTYMLTTSGETFRCSEQQAPTGGTEMANSLLPATTRNAVALGFARHAKRRFRYPHHRHPSGSRGSLAVTTVTQHAEHCVASRLVPHVAA